MTIVGWRGPHRCTNVTDPCADHSARRVAVPSIQPQSSRHRRSTSWARHLRQLRVHSPLVYQIRSQVRRAYSGENTEAMAIPFSLMKSSWGSGASNTICGVRSTRTGRSSMCLCRSVETGMPLSGSSVDYLV